MDTMEIIIEKIKEYRKKKGFSHENMAEELHISPAAYSKIEKNETKLTVVSDVGHQEIQNLYQDNKDKTEKIESLYEERLKDKDKMIDQLQDIINTLEKIKSSFMFLYFA